MKSEGYLCVFACPPRMRYLYVAPALLRGSGRVGGGVDAARCGVRRVRFRSVPATEILKQRLTCDAISFFFSGRKHNLMCSISFSIPVITLRELELGVRMTSQHRLCCTPQVLFMHNEVSRRPTHIPSTLLYLLL